MSSSGKPYGCATAIIISVVPAFPLIFGLFWGGAHCEPAPQCRHINELRTGALFAGLFIYAAIIGFGVRVLMNRIAKAQDNGSYSLGFIGSGIVVSVFAAATALASLDFLAPF
jgi:hypothetical protein